jgi:hypothetical protein
MTTTATVSAPSRVRTAGLLCAAGAALGAIGGLVMAFIPPAVGTERFSYPFTATGHRIAEAIFAVNHVFLLLGLLGVAWAGAYGTRRLGRVGFGLSVVAMVAFTLCEVAAFALADAPADAASVARLEIGYGVSSALVGLGLVLMGVAIVRERRWTGWARYAVLACGAALFVVVIPGLGISMLAGRLVLVVWMLLWAAIGVALVRQADRQGL